MVTGQKTRHHWRRSACQKLKSLDRDMNGSSDTNSRHKTLAERDCNGNQWSYAARNLFNFFQRQINHGIILSFGLC